MKHLIPFSLFMMIFNTVATADPKPPNQTPSLPGKDLFQNGITGMQDLPVTGLKMIKSGDQTLFISSNGRFAFYGGKLMDIWSSHEIRELSDIDTYASRIDLKRMNLNPEDLGAVTLGKGKASVLVLVDPKCPYCARLIKAMEPLKERYSFKLVMIPLLGPESQNIVMQLGCELSSGEPGRRQKAAERLIQQNYSGLPDTQPAGCHREPMQKAVVTARLFGITGVPFLIAPDGRVHSGAPDQLADWLEQKTILPKAPVAQPESKP